MYQNIVFDLGGVVVGFDPHNFLADRFFDEVLESTLYDLTFGTNEWKMLDAGECTREEADAAMLARAKAAGHQFEVQAILDDWFSMLRTQKDVVAVMKELRRNGYQLYYLSNIAVDVMTTLEQRSFWQLFDGGVASWEVHANKPNPVIYETLLKRYKLRREETIFIDDSAVNVKAAYDLGINSIQFQGVESLVQTLTDNGVNMRLGPKKED